jgi:4-hydroxybenzoate polyprenyltransferase
MARAPHPHPVATDASAAEASGRGSLTALLVSLRPDQWTKNLFVFAGVIFGGRLADLPAVIVAGVAFLVFCASSSAMYLVNDVSDRAEDRRHPTKSRRPIAAGELSVPAALTAAVVLGVGALAVSFRIGTTFGLISLTFIGLLGLYTYRLKHVVILDVMTISVGFVLRAVAGAVAVAVPISQWLLVCTVLLALFLGFTKRRQEVTLLGDAAAPHRRALGDYSTPLLDQLIAIVAAATLVTYAFYTMEPDTIAKFGTNRLTLTLPFPIYGVFRYLYLVYERDGGGSPSETLLRDLPLLACVTLWAAAIVLIIYTPVGG